MTQAVTKKPTLKTLATPATYPRNATETHTRAAVAKTKRVRGVGGAKRKKPTRHEWWASRALALQVAVAMAPTLSVEVPMELKSEANQRGHWATKAERVAAQRQCIRWALLYRSVANDLERVRAALRAGQHVVVGFTLRRPRTYDDDNRSSACKAVRDSVASVFGVDDGSAQCTFLPVAFEHAPSPAVLVEAWVTDACGRPS